MRKTHIAAVAQNVSLEQAWLDLLRPRWRLPPKNLGILSSLR